MDLRSLVVLIALLLITTVECRRRRRRHHRDYDEDDDENERSASSQVLQAGGNIIGTAWGTVVPDETNKAAIYGASQQYNPQGAFGGSDYYSNPGYGAGGGGYGVPRSVRRRHRRRHRVDDDDDDNDDGYSQRRIWRSYYKKLARDVADEDKLASLLQEAADKWATEKGRDKFVVSPEVLQPLSDDEKSEIVQYYNQILQQNGIDPPFKTAK